MSEILQNLFHQFSSLGSQGMKGVGVGSLVFVMLISLACSLFASFLYLVFYSSRATGSQIHRAFPLLGISITALFVCIQFSLPLSLGLLGALSIIRFRTPIKEPEEIGFIMFLISISIACATFNFQFLGILLAIAVLALVVRRYGPAILRDPQQDGVIVLSLAGGEAAANQDPILDLLDARLRQGHVESISRTPDGVEISYSFKGLKRQSLSELQDELKTRIGASNFSIFFNRPAAL